MNPKLEELTKPETDTQSVEESSLSPASPKTKHNNLVKPGKRCKINSKSKHEQHYQIFPHSKVFPKFGAEADDFMEHLSNPWLPYIGDCKAIDDFLATKDGLGWLAPKFSNALLRGVGQVVFANNPLTGLIILLSLFWAEPTVGLATTVAATTAIITAVVFRQEHDRVMSGLTTYNAVLIGSVTTALLQPVLGTYLGVKVWIFIIIMSALSVFVTTGLGNMFSSFKLPLPCLTLPFNIMVLLLFTCVLPPPIISPGNGAQGQKIPGGIAMELVQQLPDPNQNNTIGHQHAHRHVREVDVVTTPLPEVNGTDSEPMDESRIGALHWGSVTTGILLSMGQVYGVKNLVGSILMYTATLFYSPTLFMMSFAGATVGSIFGIIYADGPYEDVYDGVWGFNAILSAGAVGGVFYVLTCHSFWIAVANVILTVMIQHALALAFAPLNLPVFTMPFCLSSLIFLSLSAMGSAFPRVSKITFPEMHRYEFLENERVNKPPTQKVRDTTDEIAEEKELVLKEIKVITDDDQADTKPDSAQDEKKNGQTEAE